MECIYAAMLLHKAGKPISEDNLEAVLSAAGVNVDRDRIRSLVAALSEIDIEEAIKTPMFMPAAPAPAEAPAEAPPPKEEKEEKKEEKKEEEEVLEGLGALFG